MHNHTSDADTLCIISLVAAALGLVAGWGWLAYCIWSLCLP